LNRKNINPSESLDEATYQKICADIEAKMKEKKNFTKKDFKELLESTRRNNPEPNS